ncbi:putative peptidase (DUF1758) domain-containing protein [Ditylenchus destructor]|uniref:Peptidase (DUF1758) domain-containing protein n=1 Tax=Ditylenchus destructor TaxID=166010 RepID=A0AAD4N0H8_9BILA|nr:putative peptidase (DUF1758) domain-containing protein [Ditylenchus destructor]
MLPKASDATTSLRATSDAIERICRQLKSLGQSDDHPIVTTTIKSKLPTSVLTKLVEKEHAAGKKWNASELRQGLQNILAVKEEVQRTTQSMKSNPAEDHKKVKRSEQSHRSEQTETTRAFAVTQKQMLPVNSHSPKSECFLCEEGFHWAADCKKFPRREDRVKRLAEQKRCFVCLRRGHRAPDCRNRRNCANCDGRHNRAICLTPNGEIGKLREEKQKSTSNVGAPVDQTLSNSAVSEWKQEVFLMAKEATIASPTRQTEVRAMVFFDNGSQISYITKALANKLKLRKIRDSELEVQTFNQDSPMRMKSAVFAVHIQQNDGSMRKVIVHSTDRISGSLRTASWEGNESQLPSNIDALVPKDAQEPDVLIGMAEFWKFLQKVERLSESMYLIHSTLGPILCGRAQINTLQKEAVSSHAIVVNTSFQPEPNDENSERFRSLEGIGVSVDPDQADEKVAMKLVEEPIRMDKPEQVKMSVLEEARMNQEQKVAGVPWITKMDNPYFQQKKGKGGTLTRGIVLQELASTFDPPDEQQTVPEIEAERSPKDASRFHMRKRSNETAKVVHFLERDAELKHTKSARREESKTKCVGHNCSYGERHIQPHMACVQRKHSKGQKYAKQPIEDVLDSLNRMYGPAKETSQLPVQSAVIVLVQKEHRGQYNVLKEKSKQPLVEKRTEKRKKRPLEKVHPKWARRSSPKVKRKARQENCPMSKKTQTVGKDERRIQGGTRCRTSMLSSAMVLNIHRCFQSERLRTLVGRNVAKATDQNTL